MPERIPVKKIPLIKPYINSDTKQRVCDVLDSGFLTEGSVTKAFEETVKQHLNCGHTIAVTSCTTGLEVALRAWGIGRGDEVIVPDYTYPATASVVAIVGATIVIVDVSKETMLVDYDAIERAVTDKTKAIIPVSLFGNPLDYDRLGTIKVKHGVRILEDAACALGAEYRGVKVGNQADITVFSLHPRKFITTGEGGVIATNHADWAHWMNSYKHFGMEPGESRSTTIFERIGTNYKLSDLLAAVGVGQMQLIDELLKRRRLLAEQYIAMLDTHPKILIPQTTASGSHSRQSFCVYIDNRDHVVQAMREAGIEVQIGTYALHMHPAFAESGRCRISGDMTQSRYAFHHCLTLPLYHEMTDQDQRYVVDKLFECIG